MILDACGIIRTGLAGRARRIGDHEPGGGGTLIAFSTGDNQVADDNRAARTGCIRRITEGVGGAGGRGLKEAFERTRFRVIWEASAKRQFPALYDMVIGPLVLKRRGGGRFRRSWRLELGSRIRKDADDYRRQAEVLSERAVSSSLPDLRIERFGRPAAPICCRGLRRAIRSGIRRMGKRINTFRRHLPHGLFGGDSECRATRSRLMM